MIPKIIHYCWFGDNPKNELIDMCMETWPSLMPDYEIKEWNESNSPLGIPYCKAAIEKGLWSKVANYVRLWALFHEGGIYLDTDVEIIKKFDGFLGDGCFAGFQSVDERPGWVNNAVLGSRKEHPFIEKCMDKTVQIYEDKNEFIISPQMTTLVLKEMGLINYGYQVIQGVVIYPIEYFYPYSWREEFDPSCIKQDTFAIHHWNKSWVK